MLAPGGSCARKSVSRSRSAACIQRRICSDGMSTAEEANEGALIAYRRSARFERAYALSLPEVRDAILAAVPSDVGAASGHCFYRDDLMQQPLAGSTW